MTVWVPNKTNDDISAAHTYGPTRLVNVRYVYPDDIGDNGQIPATFTEHMQEAVRKFNPLTDYVLIVGDHLQLVAFTSMLAHAYKRYRVLRFSREHGGYYPVWINADIGKNHGQGQEICQSPRQG